MQGCLIVGGCTCPLYFDVDCTIVGSQVNEVVGFDKIREEVADFHVHESGQSTGMLR